MKVIYTIFTTSHGNGGHFYSLVTTARALSSKLDVLIVNFGFEESRAIEDSGIAHYNIILNKSNPIKAYKAFKEIINRENPDILHSFCNLSYLFVRIYSVYHPIKKILTKCGGPNPKKYYPFTQDLVLYSNENYEYFIRKNKFKKTNFYIIPNRVLEIKPDFQRINDLSRIFKIESNKRIFIRIGRISKHYERSIIQSVELINDLNQNGYLSTLILIGNIQNNEVLDRIKYIQNNNILIVTEPKFTKDASELLEIADFVIGTGRSLMEGASKGKILLTPNNVSKYPVLVTEEYFSTFLYTNFSPRNSLTKKDEEVFKEIIEILSDINKFRLLKCFSLKIFREYFDISKKVECFNQIYTKLEPQQINRYIDLIIHLVFFVRYVKKNNSS